MTLTAEAPAVLFVSAGEACRKPGALWREAARSLVVVDDERAKARNALIIPPFLVDDVLRHLGIDPATVPAPGALADSLGPEA